ncbi:hypothetical protein G3R49_13800 [Shewanella sp. WXL01]|uniref:Porin n=1 Tax=Shewanella maritima TaxID=2520507 RepID=A0A411PLT1_9GAMM|nr:MULTISPECIES: hypothetical protein [Shewanella]NKF51634.1 hypothetical protein [Shewanella sp. WXL01]QBF84451.1 hypothetical protein EXU30_18610 [Shewanella maritima]
MYFTLKTLPVAISIAMLPIAAQANQPNNDERVAKLEQQVASLQKQQNDSLKDKFHFNGFISLGYVSANNSAGYAGATTAANFEEESKFGFQGTFDISDNTQAVMQLMMRGENNWDIEAEWAYLSHRFDNGIQARAGKLRRPLFMYSDYLDVGYAQPFARPPEEVYGGVPLSTYTGGDISYDIEFEDSTISLQGFGGQSDVDNGIAKLDLTNFVGANATWTDMTWTVRGVYAQSDFDGYIGTPQGQFDIDHSKATFKGIGLGYDNGNFFMVSEVTQMKIEGVLSDNDAGYITLGYRINQFSPYVTAAFLKTTDDDERAAINPALGYGFDEQRTTYSAGIRWDALDNLAIKFDVTYAHDFDGTHGGLVNNKQYDYTSNSFKYDSTTVYTIKLDAVF